MDSIRSMLMERAMSDLRAMDCLETLTDQKTVMECLMEEAYGEITFTAYPQNASYLVQAREKINAAIQASVETQSRKPQS